MGHGRPRHPIRVGKVQGHRRGVRVRDAPEKGRGGHHSARAPVPAPDERRDDRAPGGAGGRGRGPDRRRAARVEGGDGVRRHGRGWGRSDGRWRERERRRRRHRERRRSVDEGRCRGHHAGVAAVAGALERDRRAGSSGRRPRCPGEREPEAAAGGERVHHRVEGANRGAQANARRVCGARVQRLRRVVHHGARHGDGGGEVTVIDTSIRACR
mmetsp:Transcript_4848/g.19950  ORF Transcript_4848/g.19950 Transcript_4848/m.19950 type:complete len:213 (+) Transcript_4848:289-927(+)